MSRRLEAALLLLLAGCVQMPAQPAPDGLAGTSWQLVKFQGGDDTVLMPDDKTKYTLAFGADGFVSARIDCNRGRGTWRSAGKGQLEFGPMASTRAMCPFLSLMADGGIYELEPANH